MNDSFKLDPGAWSTLRRLLDQALDLPATERAAWLESLAPEDAPFRPRLQALLAHADDAPAKATVARLLDTLPQVETAQFAPAPHDGALKAGSTVGPYRLLRPLGEGGMGEVWLAERTDLLQRRQVALKLPRLVTGRARLAERLAREREIVATLEHPNIARLYDAGVSADGQPYLALEYVEGERIDAWCARKALDVSARLRLFLQVARAVAHAHAHLVVHRDLKPANILVSAAGEVRLLDFGVAKLMDAEAATDAATETELTRAAGRAFTPEYASPEQILGQPIGTASDVYSLGVVLYELLTDERPYRLDRAAPAAMAQAVAQATAGLAASRPSTRAPQARRRALRGDLDTIVLKALKPQPQERYATVSAFAEDVQRHLEQRPVLAQPDSAAYRLRTFVRRNRLAVGAGAAVALALAGGTVVATWQAQRAKAEQQRAEQVAAFIGTVFKEANPYQQGTGRPLTGAELLRLAKDRLLAAPPADVGTRVELLTLLGTSLHALEDLPTASSVLEQAARDAAAGLGDEHARTLRARLRQADVLRVQEKNAEAIALLDSLLPALRRQRAEHPADLVAALRSRADAEFRVGRAAATEPLFAEAFEVVRVFLKESDPEHLALLALHVRVLRMRAKAPEALAASEQAMRIAGALYAATPQHPVLNEARYTHAYMLADNGRYGEAVQAFRNAFTETEALFGRASRRLAMRLGATSEVFAQAGFLKEAVANAERARATLLPMIPPRSRLDAASAEAVALAHNWSRDGQRGVPLWRHAEAVYREVMGPSHWTVQVTRRNLAFALTWAGELGEAGRVMDEVMAAPRAERDAHDYNAWIAGTRERLAARPVEALALQERALESMSSTKDADALPRAYSLTERGLAQLALGRHADARLSLTEAQQHFERRGVGLVPEQADALLGIGRLELAAGNTAAALTALQRADAFWRDLRADSPWAGEAAFWLAKALAAAGHHAEATLARQRALPLLQRSPFPVHRALAATG
jgi:serine/threonine-protein kinase